MGDFRPMPGGRGGGIDADVAAPARQQTQHWVHSVHQLFARPSRPMATKLQAFRRAFPPNERILEVRDRFTEFPTRPMNHWSAQHRAALLGLPSEALPPSQEAEQTLAASIQGGVRGMSLPMPVPGAQGGGMSLPMPVPGAQGGGMSLPMPVPGAQGGGMSLPMPVPGAQGGGMSLPMPVPGGQGGGMSLLTARTLMGEGFKPPTPGQAHPVTGSFAGSAVSQGFIEHGGHHASKRRAVALESSPEPVASQSKRRVFRGPETSEQTAVDGPFTTDGELLTVMDIACASGQTSVALALMAHGADFKQMRRLASRRELTMDDVVALDTASEDGKYADLSARGIQLAIQHDQRTFLAGALVDPWARVGLTRLPAGEGMAEIEDYTMCALSFAMLLGKKGIGEDLWSRMRGSTPRPGNGPRADVLAEVLAMAALVGDEAMVQELLEAGAHIVTSEPVICSAPCKADALRRGRDAELAPRAALQMFGPSIRDALEGNVCGLHIDAVSVCIMKQDHVMLRKLLSWDSGYPFSLSEGSHLAAAVAMKNLTALEALLGDERFNSSWRSEVAVQVPKRDAREEVAHFPSDCPPERRPESKSKRVGVRTLLEAVVLEGWTEGISFVLNKAGAARWWKLDSSALDDGWDLKLGRRLQAPDRGAAFIDEYGNVEYEGDEGAFGADVGPDYFDEFGNEVGPDHPGAHAVFHGGQGWREGPPPQQARRRPRKDVEVNILHLAAACRAPSAGEVLRKLFVALGAQGQSDLLRQLCTACVSSASLTQHVTRGSVGEGDGPGLDWEFSASPVSIVLLEGHLSGIEAFMVHAGCVQEALSLSLAVSRQDPFCAGIIQALGLLSKRASAADRMPPALRQSFLLKSSGGGDLSPEYLPTLRRDPAEAVFSFIAHGGLVSGLLEAPPLKPDSGRPRAKALLGRVTWFQLLGLAAANKHVPLKRALLATPVPIQWVNYFFGTCPALAVFAAQGDDEAVAALLGQGAQLLSNLPLFSDEAEQPQQPVMFGMVGGGPNRMPTVGGLTDAVVAMVAQAVHDVILVGLPPNRILQVYAEAVAGASPKSVHPTQLWWGHMFQTYQERTNVQHLHASGVIPPERRVAALESAIGLSFPDLLKLQLRATSEPLTARPGPAQSAPFGCPAARPSSNIVLKFAEALDCLRGTPEEQGEEAWLLRQVVQVLYENGALTGSGDYVRDSSGALNPMQEVRIGGQFAEFAERSGAISGGVFTMVASMWEADARLPHALALVLREEVVVMDDHHIRDMVMQAVSKSSGLWDAVASLQCVRKWAARVAPNAAPHLLQMWVGRTDSRGMFMRADGGSQTRLRKDERAQRLNMGWTEGVAQRLCKLGLLQRQLVSSLDAYYSRWQVMLLSDSVSEALAGGRSKYISESYKAEALLDAANMGYGKKFLAAVSAPPTLLSGPLRALLRGGFPRSDELLQEAAAASPRLLGDVQWEARRSLVLFRAGNS